jgi:hypothetical protein
MRRQPVRAPFRLGSMGATATSRLFPESSESCRLRVDAATAGIAAGGALAQTLPTGPRKPGLSAPVSVGRQATIERKGSPLERNVILGSNPSGQPP